MSFLNNLFYFGFLISFPVYKIGVHTNSELTRDISNGLFSVYLMYLGIEFCNYVLSRFVGDKQEYILMVMSKDLTLDEKITLLKLSMTNYGLLINASLIAKHA